MDIDGVKFLIATNSISILGRAVFYVKMFSFLCSTPLVQLVEMFFLTEDQQHRTVLDFITPHWLVLQVSKKTFYYLDRQTST